MAIWNTSLASRFSALVVGFPLLLACLTLTGCDGEDYDRFAGLGPAAGSPSNGSPMHTGSPTNTGSLSITGSPTGTAVVGQRWSYRPSISTPEGTSVTVTATGLPDWIKLNPTTGQLEGTPSEGDVRTWTNIRLTVNNGQASTSLTAFSVAVMAQHAAMGTATVSWSAPTQRVDGSPIGQLAGYRVLYGQNSRDYDHAIDLNTAGINRHVLEGLGEGTWYFAVQAITTDGLTSAPSREVSKRI